MRLASALVGAVLVLGGVAAAPATVTESQFPPNTVRDLIAICSADKSDPLMTAAVNFCHGFAEGAMIVEEAHEAQKGARKLFCLLRRPHQGDPRRNQAT